HRLDFRKLLAAAEDVEKLRRLPAGARERPPLEQNHAPRHDRKEREDEDDDFRRDGRTGDEIDDQIARGFGRKATLRLHLQGEPEASKRAQTALRDIRYAPLGQRVCKTVSWRANRCQTYATIGVLAFFPMLRFLRINRLAVIDSVEVEF